jgi:hypothetical protein
MFNQNTEGQEFQYFTDENPFTMGEILTLVMGCSTTWEFKGGWRALSKKISYLLYCDVDHAQLMVGYDRDKPHAIEARKELQRHLQSQCPFLTDTMLKLLDSIIEIPEDTSRVECMKNIHAALVEQYGNHFSLSPVRHEPSDYYANISSPNQK